MGRGGKREEFLQVTAASGWLTYTAPPSSVSGSSETRRKKLQRIQSDGALASIKKDKKIQDNNGATSGRIVSPRARKGRKEPVTARVSLTSKSPTYRMNAMGDRKIRVSDSEAVELEAQKVNRRCRVDLSVRETLGNGSIGNETRTTAASSFSSSMPESPPSFCDDEIKADESAAKGKAQPPFQDGDDSSSTGKEKKKKRVVRRASLGGGCTLADVVGCSTFKQEKKKKEKKDRLRTMSLGPTSAVTRRERRVSSCTKEMDQTIWKESTRDDKAEDDRLMLVRWNSRSKLKPKDSACDDCDDQSTRSVRSSSSSRLKHKYRATVDKSGKICLDKKDRDEGSDGEGDCRRVSTRSRSCIVRSTRSSTSKKSVGSQGSLRVKEKRDKKRIKREEKIKKGEDEHQEGGASTTSNTSGSGDVDECTFAEDTPKATRKSLSKRCVGRELPHFLEKSIKDRNVPVLDINPVQTADLQKEIDKLQQKLLVLKGERNSGLEEAANAKRELRGAKLELQKSQTERRELRAEIQEQDEIIREKDRIIAVIEKAVESQLDKLDELEEEARRADKVIFTLEQRLERWEGAQIGASLGEGGMDSDRRIRLEKRQKDLDSREREMEEEKQKSKGRLPHQHELDRLEKDNKKLLKALTSEKEDSICLLRAKDEEINDLRKKIVSIGTRSASGECERKTGTVGILQQEIERLNKQLDGRNPDGSPGTNLELEAAKAEASVLKSKLDGAQRRNQILEDDIDHWKSVNCNLEDDLADWKSQASTWKLRYESSSSNGILLSSPVAGRIGEIRNRPMSAAHISMMRKDNEDGVSRKDEVDSSHSAMSSLWSKLTKSSSIRSLNASTHSAQSREETASKVIFK